MSENDISIVHVQNLQKAHTQRLQILEIQAAQFGMSCPPHITIEINDIKEKIYNLELQTKRSSASSDTSPGFRHPIQSEDLEKLVAQTLQHQVKHKLQFTAYDITLALRSANPKLKIIHREARHIVHTMMHLIVELGLYKYESTMYGDRLARRYIPV